MLVPLYGFLQGDTIGLLVLVHDHHTVHDIAATLQQAATCRVMPKPHATVYFCGKALDPELTVANAGLQALDRIDVVAGED